MGKKKQPTFRVVAADSRSPRDGRFIEIIGTYAPRGRSSTDPDTVVELDNSKAIKWLRQGATPTERVQKLLQISGVWEEFKPAEPSIASERAQGNG
jgi:small subunit ribosomal protein S16